ncbi:MAG TPA: universal stress protein [Gemmatimonadales bacterium]|nr:universal stress protein [Gemmatimonadales bacterium]
MRVLCGTDFSPFSIDAGTIAALWARRAGGDLHLIHAVSRTTGLEDSRARLLAEAQRLQGFGAEVSAVDLVNGEAEQVLAEEAIARRASLIVVGSLGERGRHGRLAGTTADATARDAPIPVLVVREPGLLEQWLRGQGPLEVMVGFERGTSALGALRWAADLTGYGSVHPTVVHLVLPGAENREVHATGRGVGLTLAPEALDRLRVELQKAVTPSFGETQIRLVVKECLGRKDVPLVLEADAAGAGLLVVGSHQRKGFRRWWSGSVSSGVLHAADMSVVVVPSPAE